MYERTSTLDIGDQTKSSILEDYYRGCKTEYGVERRYDNTGMPIKDSITILTKVKIIRDCEAGLNRELIRQKYNLKSVNNISRIMINKRKFLEAYESNLISPDRKTLKRTKFDYSGERVNLKPPEIQHTDKTNRPLQVYQENMHSKNFEELKCKDTKKF